MIKLQPISVLLTLLSFASLVWANDEPALVQVAAVKQAPVQYRVSTYGVLAPNIEDLSFQINGRLTRFLVEEGQSVNRGQPLAQLDTQDAQDQLNKAQVSLDQAERRLSRFRTLHSEGSIQQSQLEDAEDDFEQVRIAFEQAQINLARCTLNAPSSGVILKEHLDSRTTVNPGQPIYSFQSDSESWLAEVNLIDTHAFNLRQGSAANIRLAPYPNVVFAGRLTRLAGLANSGDGLFLAEVSLETGGRPLKPGMIANIELYQDSDEAFFILPLDALTQLRDGRATIYLLDSAQDQSVSKVTVTVKSIMGDHVAIFETLVEGQLVVTRGQPNLADQSVVSIWTES